MLNANGSNTLPKEDLKKLSAANTFHLVAECEKVIPTWELRWDGQDIILAVE